MNPSEASLRYQIEILHAENAKLTARIEKLQRDVVRVTERKRYEIARAAMQGMLANHAAYEEPDAHGGIVMRPINPPEVAAHAVKYADALLKRLALSESKEGE